MAAPGPMMVKQEEEGAGGGIIQMEEKEYGPKAVLKEGILGNFEPRNIEAKDTPGK